MFEPLQVGATTGAFLQAYEMVGAALGLSIAYLAYRGYRRNDSPPMLYLAIGFGIILGLPIPVVAVSLLFPSIPGPTSQAVIQTLEIGGLLCIIYALRMEP
jgi:drug/metabolite transporter (DMT)-like permease